MLSPETRSAMDEALEDEYKARALYRRIIETFGPVRPFVNIVKAEDRHVRALLALYQKYGLPAPEDTWPARVTVPASIAEACRDGVAGEIENAAMYDRLLAAVEEPDIRQVFLRLREASQAKHLPAFRRCLDRESAGRGGRAGDGRQRRRGRGHSDD